jgi:tetratricopeptide (TPR) repeat protein
LVDSGIRFIFQYRKSLKKANQIRDILAQAQLYKLWGDIQKKANQSEDAHQNYVKALERYESICGKLSDPLELANIWLVIGELHQEFKQWAEALKSYEEARQKYQQLNHQQSIAKIEKRIKEIEWLQTLENLPLLEVTTPKVDQRGKPLQVEKSSVNILLKSCQRMWN